MADPHGDIAVRCRALTKVYGSGATAVAALRGVDLDVRLGELLMLVGPSGCGKTTLVSVIGTILDQDEGDCEVLGREVRLLRPKQRARFRAQAIGFVFQFFNLLPALTAAENVAVPLLLARVPYREALDRARRVLDRVGLGERLELRPGQLSGGEQQRVAIARALVHEPQLIVCDEPTSNLDHQAGRELMTILREVVQSPTRALLVVTHDSRIFDFADRIARMDDGRIVDARADAGANGSA